MKVIPLEKTADRLCMFDVQFEKGKDPVSYAVSIPFEFRFLNGVTAAFNHVNAQSVFGMTVSKVVVGPDGNPKVGV